MGHLLDNTSTNTLTANDGVTLLTNDLDAPLGSSFPLMLMLRLRIHAAWLLFMLIPGF
jgi:hypothetical protein